MEEKAIILFDGVCNFCNAAVQFVLKRDKNGYFNFAPLQSETGEKLLKKYNIDTSKTDSTILIENGKAYIGSDAGLLISRKLIAAWPLFSVLRIVPKFIRDGVYYWIARNRYKWFGKKDACMIPTPEWRSRFLS